MSQQRSFDARSVAGQCNEQPGLYNELRMKVKSRVRYAEMSCSVCEGIVERSDVPHVIRKCSGCGREIHIVEPGEHGRGIQIRAGDQVVIPDGWLRISLNPLQSTGRLSRAGLDMFAGQLFLEGLYSKEDTFAEAAAELELQTDQIVNAFEPLRGLNINNPLVLLRELEIV